MRGLAGSPLFTGVDAPERELAAMQLASGPLQAWPAGADGGLPTGSTGLVLVVAGAVELRAASRRGRAVTLARAATGEALAGMPGELIPEAETVLHAEQQSWLCPLEVTQLMALRTYPKALARLTLHLVGRLEEAQAVVVRLAHPRVEDRVLLALRALAAREGRATPGGLLLTRVRHRDLALLAHATRPRVTQALARLHDGGRLTRTGEGVLLPLEVVPDARGRRLQPLRGLRPAA